MQTPDSTLVAARRWLHELNHGDLDHCRSVFRASPAYRDLTPSQYELALDWLRFNGVLTNDGQFGKRLLEPPSDILRLALEEANPPWLSSADSLVEGPGDLPIDVLELGNELGLDDSAIFECLTAAWRKHDDSARRALGAAGELAYIDWLTARTDATIEHVSFYDDSAGFDVAMLVGASVRAQIEVKSSRNADGFSFYLSRNEYRTMVGSRRWCMQLVLLDGRDDLLDLRWVQSADIREWAPKDTSLGDWESAKFSVPPHLLRSGAPPVVAELLRPNSIANVIR